MINNPVVSSAVGAETVEISYSYIGPGTPSNEGTVYFVNKDLNTVTALPQDFPIQVLKNSLFYYKASRGTVYPSTGNIESIGNGVFIAHGDGTIEQNTEPV